MTNIILAIVTAIVLVIGTIWIDRKGEDKNDT
jgi:hypothetical protein